MPVSTSNPPPGKRLRSARGYAAYAADIGISLRTIKRWVARGKIVADPFPLEELETACTWWARHQRNTPPAELVAASARAKRANSTATAGADSASLSAGATSPAASPIAPSLIASGSAPASGSPGSAPSASNSPHQASASNSPQPLMADADMVAGTVEQNLHRLHIIHSANLTLLERAFAGSNEADIINRQRNAQRSGEMLNAAQRAFDEYQRARGDVVVIAEVKRDLVRIHSAMAQSLLSIIEDLGVPRSRAVASVDAWFRMLRESAFFADTHPEPAPSPAPAPVSAPDPAPTLAPDPAV